MAEPAWRVRLSGAAELDFANILKWTAENFGPRQAHIYRETLLKAIDELIVGPDIIGAKARDEIMRGLRTLHVARHGRRGRHFLMYLAENRRSRSCESSTMQWNSVATSRLRQKP